MKKQHLYVKENVILFLNKRVYSNPLIFPKTIELLKRDLAFFKLWNYVRLTEDNRRELFCNRFFNRYAAQIKALEKDDDFLKDITPMPLNKNFPKKLNTPGIDKYFGNLD